MTAWAIRHHPTVEDNPFVPDAITNEAGDEVHWVFIGPSDHRVTPAAEQLEDLDSGLQSSGGFDSQTVATVGGVNI